MRLLLTWTDRTALTASRTHHVPRAKDDRGPVMRLLEQKESRRAYDSAWVLTTPSHAEPTEKLVVDMQHVVKDVRAWVLPVPDPSDHELLFHALMPLVKAIPTHAQVTVLLSAGTPQAQTLWVVLVKSGLLQARMLQVIPPAFVPHPHPRAIREVNLDIEGFPEIKALRQEVIQLRAKVQARAGLIGSSAAIESLVQRIGRVAIARVPVLILGETGSGKELVARAIHAASERSAGPFLAENCGALPESTLESELFGHEKGAFTGASQQRKGLFELAHGGTLFLDELGEAGPQVQVRLLRVIETGVLRRLGGERPVTVDVRIVAATHRDLRDMVREGSFREDLYYRLKGAVLEVPPLRDHISDLEALVVHFLDEMAGARPMPTRSAWRAMQAYAWPGNVRELRAEVARWVVFCEDRVELEDLAPEIQAAASSPNTHKGSLIVPAASKTATSSTLAEIIRDVEQQVISKTLRQHDGNLSQTARALGIDRNTLKRKLPRDPSKQPRKRAR